MQPNPIKQRKKEEEEQNNFNAPEAAASPYGDLLAYQELYENQLDNIFTNYQRNIANLEQQEQENLQDAYFVREMSRKYLGEYASNTGVGDVSGNLLDIYGQYQQNISGIQQQFGQRELQLTQQYEQERESIKQDMFLNEFNIETAKINEQDKEVILNILTGNTGGLSELEYLDKMYEDKMISKRAYDEERLRIATEEKTIEERQTLARIYRGEADEAELEELFANGTIGLETYLSAYNVLNGERLEEGYRDFKTGVLTLDELLASGEYDEDDIQKITERSASENYDLAINAINAYFTEGSMIAFGRDENGELITTPEAYLESIKERFGDISDPSSIQAELFNSLQEFLGDKEAADAFTPPERREAYFFAGQKTYSTYDEDGNQIIVENPFYETYGTITDFSYFQAEGMETLGDVIFYGGPEMEGYNFSYKNPAPFVVAKESSFDDGLGTEIGEYVRENYGTAVEGQPYMLSDGRFYVFRTDARTGEAGFFLMTEASEFDEFKNIENINELVKTGVLDFNTKNDGSATNAQGTIFGIDWSYTNNRRSPDVFTFNDIEYIEDDDSEFTRPGNQFQRDIINKFKEMYPGFDRESSRTYIIFLDGKFYLKDAKGEIQALKKK